MLLRHELSDEWAFSKIHLMSYRIYGNSPGKPIILSLFLGQTLKHATVSTRIKFPPPPVKIKSVSDNANVYHIQRNFVSGIQIIHSFILLPEPNAEQSEPFLLQYYQLHVRQQFLC